MIHKKNSVAKIPIALFLLLISGFFQFVCAEPDQESTLRAALTSNFARFTTWPKTALDAMGVNMTLCLVGNPMLEEAFSGLNGKTVGDKVLQVRYLSRFNNVNECQVIYVSELDKAKVLPLLNDIKALPILTIGEEVEFIKTGGMVSIQIIGDKPTITINLKTAKAANLMISARVLKIATVIQ